MCEHWNLRTRDLSAPCLQSPDGRVVAFVSSVTH